MNIKNQKDIIMILIVICRIIYIQFNFQVVLKKVRRKLKMNKGNKIKNITQMKQMKI